MRNPNACVSDPNSFCTEPGSRFRTLYSAKVRADGSLDVQESGKEDIQDYIESFRDSTDISFVLKQLALGNTSVLNQSAAQYGDFTHMPRTMAEAMQLQIDAEREFYKLPLDVRGKFENDFRRWLVSAGSADWLDKMGFVSKNDQVENVDQKGESADSVID